MIDIVVDFFAGVHDSPCRSAINREDGGNRRFIMVQFREPCHSQEPASNYRRHRQGTHSQRHPALEAEDAGKLTTGRDAPEDLGFRVFKLDRSSYKAWRDFEGGDVAELQTLFDRFESPLVEGWQPEDVLVEVMLMEGFPLDSTTEALPEFTRNTVTRVSRPTWWRTGSSSAWMRPSTRRRSPALARGRGRHLHLPRQRADGRGEGAVGRWAEG